MTRAEIDKINAEIASLELLAWMADDSDNAAKAKRLLAKAEKLRKTVTR